MTTPPRGFQFPDTSHLAPEDAELLRALYWERNTVSRTELGKVTRQAIRYRRATRDDA